VVTAESCTGGLLGAMITDVPGSSAVYLGGWVTYSGKLKAAELAVPAEVIERHGEVSREVVEAMAAGACRKSGADYALAITGIAGPTGGTPGKPVGTVWLGMAQRGGNEEILAQSWLLRVVGTDRQSIRDRSAKTALQALRLTLLGESVEGMSWIARR
jgi:nicotinamide-nucleotide amidase